MALSLSERGLLCLLGSMQPSADIFTHVKRINGIHQWLLWFFDMINQETDTYQAPHLSWFIF